MCQVLHANQGEKTSVGGMLIIGPDKTERCVRMYVGMYVAECMYVSNKTKMRKIYLLKVMDGNDTGRWRTRWRTNGRTNRYRYSDKMRWNGWGDVRM